MIYMNTAMQITDRITMHDVFLKYGFEEDRKGNICCPFHNETKPSLGTYANKKRWHCFGCNEGGSVIDFVMKLYDLTFKQAIVKLDYDFNLQLFNRYLSREERARLKEQEIERKKRLEEERRAKAERSKAFYDILDMWVKNDKIIARYKGLSRCAFDYSEEYWKSLLYRQCASYLLDCTER